MTNPFKVGCHCGFVSDDPQLFLHHCVETGHVFSSIDITETGALAELGVMLETLHRAAAAESAGEPVVLPEGAEIKPLDVEDILTDESLSDEERVEILTRLDAIAQLAARRSD